ncbi:unnamed protein product [Sphagnum jensenii]
MVGSARVAPSDGATLEHGHYFAAESVMRCGAKTKQQFGRANAAVCDEVEAMHSKLSKNIQEVLVRLDRDLKGQVVKIMNSQSDNHGDHSKRTVSRVSSLEGSVNIILQKLEGYNSVL